MDEFEESILRESLTVTHPFPRVFVWVGTQVPKLTCRVCSSFVKIMIISTQVRHRTVTIPILI